MREKTELEKLAERIAALASQKGLIDIKFDIDQTGMIQASAVMNTELLAKEINELFAAYESGDFIDLNFKDSPNQVKD